VVSASEAPGRRVGGQAGVARPNAERESTPARRVPAPAPTRAGGAPRPPPLRFGPAPGRLCAPFPRPSPGSDMAAWPVTRRARALGRAWPARPPAAAIWGQPPNLVTTGSAHFFSLSPLSPLLRPPLASASSSPASTTSARWMRTAWPRLPCWACPGPCGGEFFWGGEREMGRGGRGGRDAVMTNPCSPPPYLTLSSLRLSPPPLPAAPGTSCAPSGYWAGRSATLWAPATRRPCC